MISTNAIFYRKESSFETTPCIIEKVITLSGAEYDIFRDNMLKDCEFISENKECMYVDVNGTTHCLLVLGENRDDGVLIDSQGFDYSRCSSFLPNARLLIESQTQIQNHEESQVLKFYCPLTIQSDAESNELYEMSSADALPYKVDIQKAIDNYNDRTLNNSEGLMEYFDESKSVKKKVLCYKPTTIIEHDGQLYGVIEAKINGVLTDEELEILKQAMTGQMSDGYGEGFEQQEIPYEGGNLYVSFWHSGNGYFVKTEDEFQEYLEQQEQSGSMTMGG
jgi:hypothetical protein